jgi:hypothetical protein
MRFSVGAAVNAVVWIVMPEAANRLASDTFYLQSRHNRPLTNNYGAERAHRSSVFDGGLDMRIHHLVVLATVACVPLAACVPTYGPGYGLGYADGEYGYAPGPVAVAPAVVIAGGEYYGGGPYYGGGYGYRGPYGADGYRQGNDPRRYQQQRYNQAVVARQQQYNQAVLAQQQAHNQQLLARQNAYNEAVVARQKAGLPSPPFQ